MLKYIVLICIIYFRVLVGSIVGNYDQLVFIQHSPIAALHLELQNLNIDSTTVVEYIQEHRDIFNGQNWIIRSLRAINKTSSDYVKNCKTELGISPTYHPENMIDIFIDNWKRKWPNLNPLNTEEDLWEAEFNTYGCCIIIHEWMYFQDSIFLSELYSVGDILRQSDIVPGSKYTVERVVNSLREAYNDQFFLKCQSTANNRDQYLLEVQICFTPDYDLIACHNQTHSYGIHGCDMHRDVIYPGSSTFMNI